MTVVRPIVSASMCALLMVWAQAAAAQPAPPAGPPQAAIVVTTGEATLKAAPDRAFVSVATSSRAQTPTAAQRQSADALAAVFKVLRGSGIADAAIRTVRYDIQPLFDYVNGKQISRGYQATNAVEVQVDALDRLGVVLDAVVGAGATEVGGVRFDLKNREALERDALKQAVASARAKADAAAAGASRSVESILRIEESGVRLETPQPVMIRMAADRAAAEPTPVSPGEVEVTSRVTLTARLNQP